MGKGNTTSDAASRRRRARAGERGTGGTVAISPCAGPLPITLTIDPGAEVAVGDIVTIVLGRPPTARVRQQNVGTLTGSSVPEIEGCIDLTYRFSGRIESVNASGDSATGWVVGRKEA